MLAIELGRRNIDFRREVEQEIYYKENHIGTRRADFIIKNKLVIELKAVMDLEDVHWAQAKNYLVAYDFDIGLLINFGATRLQYKRIFKSNKQSSGKSFNPVNPDADN